MNNIKPLREYEVRERNEHGFHIEEILESLKRINYLVDADLIKLLSKIYSLDDDLRSGYDAQITFLQSLSFENVVQLDMSSWTYKHLYFWFYALPLAIPNDTPGHLFILKAYGQFIYTINTNTDMVLYDHFEDLQGLIKD